MWAVKHKSGRVLFVTSDECTANNRRDMGWIVDVIMRRCKKCNGTGMADSGGVHPWGEPIFIECDCKDGEMTSREQFEDFVRENLHPGASNAVIRLCWHAWQASRSAIEVELPSKRWDISYDGSQHYDCDEVHESLTQVGLKVRGE